MSLLIKSLLNYSRLAKNKNELAEVDLNSILHEAKQDFELLIEEKNAVIVSDALPVIQGNAIQLGQLFSNLISNSLKFSIVEPIIKINATVIEKVDIPDAPAFLIHSHYHRINFEDNGIGFEQQYDQLIFSLFQRLNGRQDFPGTGIGLALCKKIVDNHKGLISAYSELGKGAKFVIYLPVESFKMHC